MPKRATKPVESDGVVESEHFVAVEVDQMTVRQKLDCLEAYHADGHRFITRTFEDHARPVDEWVEVFVFRKPEEASSV